MLVSVHYKQGKASSSYIIRSVFFLTLHFLLFLLLLILKCVLQFQPVQLIFRRIKLITSAVPTAILWLFLHEGVAKIED